MKTSLVLVAILAAVLAQSADNDTGTLKVLSRAFDKCNNDSDMYSCLKVKAVNLLDRALAVDSLPLSDYVAITKDPKAKNSAASVHQTKGDLEASLPRDLNQKSSTLDKMIQERLSKYLETRTIQLNMPTDVFEGRKGWKGYKGKGDKGGGILMVVGAFGAFLVQLALGKIALLAGKALLVGKVALLLAGIIGLTSLFSKGHVESQSSQVIYAEPEHHGGWGRSMGSADVAQQLAYRGHRSAFNH